MTPEEIATLPEWLRPLMEYLAHEYPGVDPEITLTHHTDPIGSEMEVRLKFSEATTKRLKSRFPPKASLTFPITYPGASITDWAEMWVTNSKRVRVQPMESQVEIDREKGYLGVCPVCSTPNVPLTAHLSKEHKWPQGLIDDWLEMEGLKS